MFFLFYLLIYLFCKSLHWLLKMFFASALWPLCLLQHFSIPLTLHNPHYPFFVSPRLSLCLSQLPVSLILNPVEIGQAEWASFDQALISGVLTVSAHPDPTEPWSPGGELQTGVHPLTLLERKGKREAAEFLSQLPATHSVISLSFFKFSKLNTIYLGWHLLLFGFGFFRMSWTCCGKKRSAAQCNAIWGWEQCTAQRCESHFCFCQPCPWQQSMESVSLVRLVLWSTAGDDTCLSARHVTKHLAILWHKCIMQEN